MKLEAQVAPLRERELKLVCVVNKCSLVVAPLRERELKRFIVRLIWRALVAPLRERELKPDLFTHTGTTECRSLTGA